METKSKGLYFPERASKKEAAATANSTRKIATPARLLRLLLALIAILVGPAYFLISPESRAGGSLGSSHNRVPSEVAAAQLQAGITDPFIVKDPLLRRLTPLDLTAWPIVSAAPKSN